MVPISLIINKIKQFIKKNHIIINNFIYNKLFLFIIPESLGKSL